MDFFTQLRRVSSVFLTLNHYIKKAEKDLDGNKDLPKEKRNQYMQDYCQFALNTLGVKSQSSDLPKIHEPSIFVGNHISYLDIPLLIKHYPVIFVAKKEIIHWPYIGKAGKLTKIILVQRNKANSRRKAAKQIAEKLREQNDCVAIFPSGTTSMNKETFWKKGAFRIAKEFDIPVVPFRINYSPIRKAAFVGQDYFLPHIFNLAKEATISAEISFQSSRKILDIDKDMIDIRSWCNDALKQ